MINLQKNKLSIYVDHMQSKVEKTKNDLNNFYQSIDTHCTQYYHLRLIFFHINKLYNYLYHKYHNYFKDKLSILENYHYRRNYQGKNRQVWPILYQYKYHTNLSIYYSYHIYMNTTNRQGSFRHYNNLFGNYIMCLCFQQNHYIYHSLINRLDQNKLDIYNYILSKFNQLHHQHNLINKYNYSNNLY